MLLHDIAVYCGFHCRVLQFSSLFKLNFCGLFVSLPNDKALSTLRPFTSSNAIFQAIDCHARKAFGGSQVKVKTLYFMQSDADFFQRLSSNGHWFLIWFSAEASSENS